MTGRQYIIGGRTTIDDETGTVHVTITDLDDSLTAALDGHAEVEDPTGASGSGRARLVPVGIIAAVVLLAAAAIAGWFAHAPSPAATGLRGAFVLAAPAGTTDGCAAQPNAVDIVAGAPVVVADENGVTIRSTTLGRGVAVDGGHGCQFPFDVGSVGAQPAIVITVGHQSGLRFTAQELDDLHNTVVLRLGAPAGASR